MTKSAALLLTVLCLSAPVAAQAAEDCAATGSWEASPAASYAIYSELILLLLPDPFPKSGSLGISSEYRFSRRFAVSGGFGAGVVASGVRAPGGAGVQALAHWLLLGQSEHWMEVALGGAVSFGYTKLAMPAAFLGYRYHPMDGGRLIRIGLGWSHVFGVGLSVGGGYAF